MPDNTESVVRFERRSTFFKDPDKGFWISRPDIEPFMRRTYLINNGIMNSSVRVHLQKGSIVIAIGEPEECMAEIWTRNNWESLNGDSELSVDYSSRIFLRFPRSEQSPAIIEIFAQRNVLGRIAGFKVTLCNDVV